MISLTEIADAWNVFFFQPEPVVSIAVFRILLGLICMANAWCFLLCESEHYAPDALIGWDLSLQQFGAKRFSLLKWLPPTHGWVRFVLILHFLSTVTLTAGFLTRASCIVALVTLTTIHHRNMVVLDASDTICRLFVFLLCFAPAGKALAVDAGLFADHDLRYVPLHAPWAMRLIQLQVSLIYIQSVRLKLTGEKWRKGTAAWYPLQLERFAWIPYPRRLMGHRYVLKTATWGVLATELSVGLLIWIRELTLPMVVAGFLLHTCFGMFLQLRLFGFVMACGLLLYVPAETWLVVFRSIGMPLKTITVN